MGTTYWSKVVGSRISRRRAMAAPGGFALGAAFLAACGGSDSKEPQNPDKSGLLSQRDDTSSKAVPGGILPQRREGGQVVLDPHITAGARAYGEVNPVYSTLTKFSLAN